MNKNLVGALVVIFGLLTIAGALADNITVSANVQKYISVTFNYTAVDFGTVTTPAVNTSAPGAYKATINTNYDYYVQAWGNDFTGPSGTMPISNLALSISPSYPVPWEIAIPLTTTAQNISSFSPDITENYHGYFLTVPLTVRAGTYTTQVTIIYTNQ